jgi:hypothetical protein
LSSAARGLERRSDAWWWNPDETSWEKVIGTILPDGGRVAVPGGRRVFDLFLAIGYDGFHLSRVDGSRVPGGVALFSACDQGKSAETVLARAGMTPRERKLLDPVGPVDLTIWSR